jgi:hypothetical protein
MKLIISDVLKLNRNEQWREMHQTQKLGTSVFIAASQHSFNMLRAQWPEMMTNCPKKSNDELLSSVRLHRLYTTNCWTVQASELTVRCF